MCDKQTCEEIYEIVIKSFIQSSNHAININITGNSYGMSASMIAYAEKCQVFRNNSLLARKKDKIEQQQISLRYRFLLQFSINFVFESSDTLKFWASFQFLSEVPKAQFKLYNFLAVFRYCFINRTLTFFSYKMNLPYFDQHLNVLHFVFFFIMLKLKDQNKDTRTNTK